MSRHAELLESLFSDGTVRANSTEEAAAFIFSTTVSVICGILFFVFISFAIYIGRWKSQVFNKLWATRLVLALTGAANMVGVFISGRHYEGLIVNHDRPRYFCGALH